MRVRMNPSLDEAGKKAAADTYLTKDLKEWCGKLEKSLGVFKGAPQRAGACLSWRSPMCRCDRGIDMWYDIKYAYE